MRLSLDPFVAATRGITAESFALASWYDSHPAVRRLWGIKNAQTLRVIVALEPTPDNDDVYPAWFAHTRKWAHELRLCTGSPVQLELIHFDGIEIDADSVIIADLFWRDATIYPPCEVL